MRGQQRGQKWFEAVKNLEGLMEHIAVRAKSPGERYFYIYYTRYFQKVIKAVEEGKEIAAHSTFIPPEIFYAMDIVPILLVSSCGAMTTNLKNYQEALDSCQKHGICAETCSTHRIQMAHFLEGWFPEPKLIAHMGGQGCDAFCNSGHVSAEIYGCPDFYVDVPNVETENGVKYLTEEFKDLVSFVEDVVKRKMDWDRLKEILTVTVEMTNLWREIGELRKMVPSPMESKRAWQIYWMYWIYTGSQEGLEWFRIVRDELREKVAKGEGAIPNERFRLLDLFMPPQYSFQLLDWMGKEFGAIFVNETLISRWGDGELDPSKPLEALVKRHFIAPVIPYALRPGRDLLSLTVKQAKAYKAHGAVFWAQNACRQTGMIGPLKDALREEADIPTLIIDCDVMDPSFVTVEEMKQRLKSFFEMLESRN